MNHHSLKLFRLMHSKALCALLLLLLFLESHSYSVLSIPNRCFIQTNSKNNFHIQQHFHRNRFIVSKLKNSSEQHNEAFSKISAEKIFEPFATYAWEKLIKSELVKDSNEKIRNESILPNDSGQVNLKVEILVSKEKENSILRQARYALLSTNPPSSPAAIEVLNLVIFPETNVNLPIFGADLVILPGNRNLMLIDFQPVSSNETLESGEGKLEINSKEIETKLKDLHELYSIQLPFGGEIPRNAKQFISKYALWTRIQDDLLNQVSTTMFQAFCDYFDLYLKLCLQYHSLEERDILNYSNLHREYLIYRRDNDPARPMLKRLFGEEYAESLICDVLFKSL